MKKDNRKKKLQLLLTIVMVHLLVGCSSPTLYYTEMTSDEEEALPTSESVYKLSENDLGIANMQLVAEDGKAILYYNPKTAEIAVERKDTKTVWFSNPQDRLAATDSQINAQLVITTLDKRDTEKTWDSFHDSVAYGQFSKKDVKNGITVTYLIGKKPVVNLYPGGLTVDRYNAIVEALPSEKEKGYMKRLYGWVEYDKLTSTQTKESLRGYYTNVEELNTMYSLKGNMSKLEMKNLTRTFEAIGYTIDKRLEDEALVGYASDSTSDNFTVSVTYTLENGELCVEVDPLQIKSTEGLKISEISILRNFGAQKSGENGYLFVPDGSGAIINTNLPKKTVWGEYNRKVYGQDFGLLRTDRTEYSEQLYLPIFGAYHSKGGFIGIAEKDDGQMSILAGRGSSFENYSFVYPNFLLLAYSLVTIESSAVNSLNIYPSEAVTDLIKLRYIFSDEENTGYDDLAVLYRDYMIENGQLDGENDKAGVPVMANAIGAIDDIRSILGYPAKVIKPLTKYNEISELAINIKKEAPEGDIVIGYSGWLEGGIKTGFIKKADIENKLGNSKELKNMAADLRELGVTLMPVVEQQYCYEGKWYQGFNPLDDAIRFITRDTGYKPEHNIANYYMDGNGLKPYIIRPYIVEKNAKTFIKSYNKYNIGALSVGSMSSEIYSDFYTKQILSTNDTINYFKNVLNIYRKNGNVLGGKGANAYTLFAMDYAYDLPVSASNHPIIEQSVPFLQIVLSGSVSYTMPRLNTQNDTTMYLLKAIETGSGVYFDYMASKGSEIKGTDYDGYYSASHDSIYEIGQQIGSEVSNVLATVANKKIIHHREIADNVFVTSYENGISIGVNYTDKEFDHIPAKGFIIMK